ncbi:uncharacterized protein LOC114328267 isoform X2 [Diabrotica virgifera virgifera]|uniref:Uncharacterized protein LOC114328267 isoform X2 n=1 Tax=Diabrotica virgifera virgifera TaxID=50390 RepID=A0A6P7FII7_DIAVI|nr:uncharacterized protein LOC114328267 isoform X2 [Diabrotica virgifera virgifera]
MVVEGEYYDGPCKLLELPHDVLRILFSYLNATSLYHLSRTCNYLEEFILDPLLWRYVDARDNPNVCDKIHYCTNRVHKKTTHLYLRGNLCIKDLPDHFFINIKPFDNLRVLALENIKLNGSKISLKDFPSGLEELSLRRTYVKNSTYFFQHTVRNMPKLKVLILDECSWVTCSFLLSVAKYEHLEIISIVKCPQVHVNMVPYLNVAKLGCKKLKVFDCRFTGIGGELLRTFYSKQNLQRLYFQSFASAKVDYNENVFDYIKKIEKREGDDMSITDIHLRDYLSTTAKPKNEVEEIFDSVLYRDPYPECICGGEGFREGINIMDKDGNIPEKDLIHFSLGQLEYRFICGKHLQDFITLPPDFKNFYQQQLDTNLDSDSSTDKEDDEDDDEPETCCHYANSYVSATNNLLTPSTHDRTPSVREEMTLPNEGARNQSFPGCIRVFKPQINKVKRKKQRLYVQHSSMDNNNASSSDSRTHEQSDFGIDSNNRIHGQSDNSSDSNKRTHGQSDSSSDSNKRTHDQSYDIDDYKKRTREQSECNIRTHEQCDSTSDMNIPPREQNDNGNHSNTRTHEVSDNETDSNKRTHEQSSSSDAFNNRTHEQSGSGSGSNKRSLQQSPSGSGSNKRSHEQSDSGSGYNKRSHEQSDHGSGSNKLFHEESDNDDDSEATTSKKPKRGPVPFDDLQAETQAQLIDHLIESADDISSRINRIMTSGIRRGFDRIMMRQTEQEQTENARKIERENQPSTSRDTNGVSSSSPSTSSANSDAENRPSSSKARTPEGDKNGNNVLEGLIVVTEAGRPHIEINPTGPRVQIRCINFPREDNDRWKIKWKIPLRRLSLRGYKKISDNTLNYLKNLDIELIDLTYTSVSQKGIENFLVHNPNCRVIHPLYCVCKPNNTLY